MNHFHKRWFQLVTMYTAGQLTQESDKLIAMSGVAKAVQGEKSLIYLAGLWKEYIHLDLLWCMKDVPSARPAVYLAPSWSWASVNGKVSNMVTDYDSTYNGVKKDCIIDPKCAAVIKNIVVTLRGISVTDAASPFNGGYLDIKAPALKATRLFSSTKQLRLDLDLDIVSTLHGNHLLDVNFAPDVVLADKSYHNGLHFNADNNNSVSLSYIGESWICIRVLRIFSEHGRFLDHDRGLVLRKRISPLLKGHNGVEYERIGFFWTDRAERDPFGKSPLGTFRIT